jgi:hypothetical protein
MADQQQFDSLVALLPSSLVSQYILPKVVMKFGSELFVSYSSPFVALTLGCLALYVLTSLLDNVLAQSSKQGLHSQYQNKYELRNRNH